MKLVNLLIITLLCIFAGSVQAGTLVANKTLDISFDGHTDGMHLIINQKTGIVSGNVTGVDTFNESIIGTVGSTSKLGASITVMVVVGGILPVIYVIDDNPKKWTAYLETGLIIFSGTYSKGLPAPAFGELSRSVDLK